MKRLIAFIALFACNIFAVPVNVADSAVRTANRRALSGQTITGVVYIFASPATAKKRVRFWMDLDPNLSQPTSEDLTAPFDFRGTLASGQAIPFDTTSLSNGVHRIATQSFADDAVETPDGVESINFIVSNAGNGPSGPTTLPQTIPLYENFIFQVFLGIMALVFLGFFCLFCLRGCARGGRKTYQPQQDLSYMNADNNFVNSGYSANPVLTSMGTGKNRINSIFSPLSNNQKVLAVHRQGNEVFEFRQSPWSGYAPEWHDARPQMTGGKVLKATAPSNAYDYLGNQVAY